MTVTQNPQNAIEQVTIACSRARSALSTWVCRHKAIKKPPFHKVPPHSPWSHSTLVEIKTHGPIHHHSIHRRQSGGDCRFYVASREGVSYERPHGAAGRLSLTMDRLGDAVLRGECYLWTAPRARRALSTYIASEKSHFWTAPRVDGTTRPEGA